MIGEDNGITCSRTRNRQSTDYVYHWLNTETFEAPSLTDWTTLDKPISKFNLYNTNSSKPTKLYDNIKSLFKTPDKNNNHTTKTLIINKSSDNYKHKHFYAQRQPGIFTKLMNNMKLNNTDNCNNTASRKKNKKKVLASLDWKLFVPENKGMPELKNLKGNNRNKMYCRHCHRFSLKRCKSDSIVSYRSKYLFFNQIDATGIDYKFDDQESEQLNNKANETVRHCTNNVRKHLPRFPFTMKPHVGENEIVKFAENKIIKMKTKRKATTNMKKIHSCRKSKKGGANVIKAIESVDTCRRREFKIKTYSTGTQTLNFMQSNKRANETQNLPSGLQYHSNCHYAMKKGKTKTAQECTQTEFSMMNSELTRSTIPGCTCSLNKLSAEKHKEYFNVYSNTDSITPDQDIGKDLNSKKTVENSALSLGKNSPDGNVDKTIRPMQNFFLYSGQSINNTDINCLQNTTEEDHRTCLEEVPLENVHLIMANKNTTTFLQKQSNIEQKHAKYNCIYSCTMVNSNNSINNNNRICRSNMQNQSPLEETLLSFYALKLDGQAERKIMIKNTYQETKYNVNKHNVGDNFKKPNETIITTNKTNYSNNNINIMNQQQTIGRNFQQQNHNGQYKQNEISMNFKDNVRIKQINKRIVENETKFQTCYNDNVRLMLCNSRFVNGVQFVNNL